jgi:glycosyltransferase involved in cell wall biosynthesis
LKIPGKVAFNALVWNMRPSGVQYYCQRLLAAFDTIDLTGLSIDVLVPEDYDGTVPRSRNMRIILVSVPAVMPLRRITFENFCLPKELKKQEVRLYHAPNYILPVTLQLPAIVTVHDLISLKSPQLVQTGSFFYHWLLQRRTLKNAIGIIAVSNAVKNELVSQFHVPVRKISVIPNGVTKDFATIVPAERLAEVKARYKLPEKYLLFVGNIEPKKNLISLLQALGHSRENSGVRHKLVIAGQVGWKSAKLFSVIASLKLHDDVILTGYIPERDLPAVYAQAALFVFPSLDEGFGIPPLEAMAAGIPVITSNRGALPEVTGGHCTMVNPLDIATLSTNIDTLVRTRNTPVLAAAKEWTKKFDWSTIAQNTATLYRQLLASQA